MWFTEWFPFPTILRVVSAHGLRYDCVRARATCMNLHVQVRLPSALSILDALGHNLLGFLDELTVQINRVRLDPSHGIVLAKDVV